MQAKPRTVTVEDAEYGTVTIPLRGVASVTPNPRETRTQAADATTRPLLVSEARALFASYHRRNRRKAILSAARVRETRRRRHVESALSALSALLTPAEPVAKPETPKTKADALEALYASYRQRRRECASLMQRKPHDGRPPMVGTASGTAANAQETRGMPRWFGTPRAVRLTLTRDDGSPFVSECVTYNAKTPNLSPRVFTPAKPERTSRKPRVTKSKAKPKTTRGFDRRMRAS